MEQTLKLNYDKIGWKKKSICLTLLVYCTFFVYVDSIKQICIALIGLMELYFFWNGYSEQCKLMATIE